MRNFSVNTKVVYGEGALEHLNRVKNKRVLMVTDAYMEQSGTCGMVASHLTDCDITVFSGVTPDPTTAVVTEGVKVLCQCKAEVIVAVGGGSVIDAAKAIHQIGKQVSADGAYVEECFAIPTTSGTGSEATGYAVITDAERGIKYPLSGEELLPPTAILEPRLVVSAPKSVTADGGMDVLTHAMEAYVSRVDNDFSDALAEKAVSLVGEYLPLAYERGDNLVAREKMHNASCLAGMAFNTAGLGLCHGMAHAMGARYHIPHGRANAMILPHIIRYNSGFIDGREKAYSNTIKKYRHLALVLDLPAADARTAIEGLAGFVESLNRAFKIPSTLKDMFLVMKPQDLEDMTVAALADITTAGNPRTASAEDIKAMYRMIAG